MSDYSVASPITEDSNTILASNDVSSTPMRKYRRYSTDEIVRALEKANGLISVAARLLGCTPKTIYRRAEESPRVREIIENAREELVDIAEIALRSALLRGESWAVSMVLRTLGRSRGYSEQLSLDVRQEPTKLYSVVSDPKWLEKKDG